MARRAAQVKHSLALAGPRSLSPLLRRHQCGPTAGDVARPDTRGRGTFTPPSIGGAGKARWSCCSDGVARVQSKLERLEVFIVGFFAVGIIYRHHPARESWAPMPKTRWSLLGGPLFIGLTAWILKPWRRKQSAAKGRNRQAGMDPHRGGAVACVIAWLAGLAHVWTKWGIAQF